MTRARSGIRAQMGPNLLFAAARDNENGYAGQYECDSCCGLNSADICARSGVVIAVIWAEIRMIGVRGWRSLDGYHQSQRHQDRAQCHKRLAFQSV
jgi:hypothetical protein